MLHLFFVVDFFVSFLYHPLCVVLSPLCVIILPLGPLLHLFLLLFFFCIITILSPVFVITFCFFVLSAVCVITLPLDLLLHLFFCCCFLYHFILSPVSVIFLLYYPPVCVITLPLGLLLHLSSVTISLPVEATTVTAAFFPKHTRCIHFFSTLEAR